MNVRERMSVFFVAPGLLEVPNDRGGGIEKNIFDLAEHTAISTIIFSPHPRQAVSPTRASRTLVKYSVVPAIKIYPPPPHFCLSNVPHYLMGFLLHLDAAARILISNREIDTVIVFNKFSGFIPFIVAWLTRKNRVYMEYNIWPWTYSGDYRPTFFKLHIAFGKLIARMSSIITANSPSIKIGMVSNGIDSSKIFLVPTGIEIRSIAQRKNRRIYSREMRVLYAGRLVEERGADLLPEVIKIVLKNRTNIFFKIVGAGPLFQTIRSFVKKNNLENNVELLGQINRTKVIELMKEPDVTLFISKNEDYGSLALLECMAVGCPVIATNVGSTSKIVIDKFNGILVNPNANSIAHAILMLNDHQTLIEQMGENCKRTAKEYDWEVVSAKFLKALRKISDNKR